MSKTALFPTIMAGGSGTRLWPESRKNRPKQFLPLLNDGRSLLRAALDRIAGLAPTASTFIVSGKNFDALTREAAPELPRERILLEPIGRDTAPCVAWAALEAARLDPDAVMVVMPSDHLIEPDEAFRNTILRAVEIVEREPDALVTLGVEPTYPATGYGYIERAEELPDMRGAYRVKKFHEKPSAEKAREYVDAKSYFWNAGIFVWKARTFLDLLREFEPELGATIETLAARIEATRASGARPEDDQEFVDAFSKAKRISVDYAVLERAPKVCVVAANEFRWNDLGSFKSLEELESPVDPKGNSVVGGELVARNASGNYARISGSNAKKLVVLDGVDDLLVVDTGDVLLVAKKGSDRALKELVNKLKDEGFEDIL